MPERGGRAITLQDLATHTSGLPRLPTNMAPKDAANPYADYSFEDLYTFLSAYQLSRDIGSENQDSNLGGGLLGHVLTLQAHATDYEALVRARVTAPLGMPSTAITLPPEMKSRLAAGHSAQLQPVANWDLLMLAGAGAFALEHDRFADVSRREPRLREDVPRTGHGDDADREASDRRAQPVGGAWLARADDERQGPHLAQRRDGGLSHVHRLRSHRARRHRRSVETQARQPVRTTLVVTYWMGSCRCSRRKRRREHAPRSPWMRNCSISSSDGISSRRPRCSR